MLVYISRVNTRKEKGHLSDKPVLSQEQVLVNSWK